MSQWISVEDRLPDEFIRVLVSRNSKSDIPAVHESIFISGEFRSPVSNLVFVEPTHWMPLPEPPK